VPKLHGPSLDVLPGPVGGRSEVFHWDEQVRGFGLRVRASGRRYWVVQFRVGSTIRRVNLGDAATLSMKDARLAARRMLAQARLGHDPRLEIEARKAAASAKPEMTTQALAELYLECSVERRLKPRTVADVRYALIDLAQPIHGLDAGKVARRDLAELVQRLAVSNGPRTADLVGIHLSTMFNWAIRSGLLDTNPAARLPRQHETRDRDRFLRDAELKIVWQALPADRDYSDAIRLLILTGQRRAEVGGMRWSEIDRARALWTIPGNRTKNGRPHEVPLADPALTILDERERSSERDLVFGSGAGGFSGWSAAKRRLDAAIVQLGLAGARYAPHDPSGLPPWRVHDLRRTVVTGMVTIGVLPHVVEAVVNHVSGHRAGVAGVYNRATYAAEKRDALNRWAAHVAGLVGDARPGHERNET
jgi:integrase